MGHFRRAGHLDHRRHRRDRRRVLLALHERRAGPAIINAVWQAIQLFAATAVAAIQSIDWEPLIDAGRDLWAQVQALGQSFGRGGATWRAPPAS